MTTKRSPAQRPRIGRPQRVKSVIALRRITQREIANQTHTSEFHVSRVFNGRDLPSHEFASAVARLLQLPERQLFRRWRATGRRPQRSADDEARVAAEGQR